MQIARKLLLLCATAIAALALTAGTAAAQETPVEVSAEDGAHCDPCPIEAESVVPSEIVTHVFGHEEFASQCEDHFLGEVYEDGSGHITDQHLEAPAGGGPCTQKACPSPEEVEWPITEMGELGSGIVHMHVEFCLQAADESQPENHCDAEVIIEEVGPHEYVASIDEHCPIQTGVESEVTGQWEIHDSPIEIEHL